MRELAARHGEAWLAYLIPLSVDGMIVVASLVIVNAGRTRAPRALRPWLAWLTLFAGVGVSLAANVAAASPDLISRFVAAWPPLAFAVSFEHVIHLLRGPRTRSGLQAGILGGGVVDDAGEPVVNSDDTDVREHARELIEADPDIGRRRLRKELGPDRVSDHQARQLLAELRPPATTLHAVSGD
jgi:hypothetical protein